MSVGVNLLAPYFWKTGEPARASARNENEHRRQNAHRASARAAAAGPDPLVEHVLDSLDRADPAIDQMWAREASDRLAAYRRGELAAKDLGDIVAKYRP
jgi:hypothetical protein